MGHEVGFDAGPRGVGRRRSTAAHEHRAEVDASRRHAHEAIHRGNRRQHDPHVVPHGRRGRPQALPSAGPPGGSAATRYGGALPTPVRPPGPGTFAATRARPRATTRGPRRLQRRLSVVRWPSAATGPTTMTAVDPGPPRPGLPASSAPSAETPRPRAITATRVSLPATLRRGGDGRPLPRPHEDDRSPRRGMLPIVHAASRPARRPSRHHGDPTPATPRWVTRCRGSGNPKADVTRDDLQLRPASASASPPSPPRRGTGRRPSRAHRRRRRPCSTAAGDLPLPPASSRRESGPFPHRDERRRGTIEERRADQAVVQDDSPRQRHGARPGRRPDAPASTRYTVTQGVQPPSKPSMAARRPRPGAVPPPLHGFGAVPSPGHADHDVPVPGSARTPDARTRAGLVRFGKGADR